jgi:hypothetical protein
VYGLRVRERGGETLFLFLPRGTLLATSGSYDAPIDEANAGPYTRFSFPMGAGAAARASARIGPSALEIWAAMRRSASRIAWMEDESPSSDKLLVEADVVTEGDRRSGALRFFAPQSQGRAGRAYTALLRSARDAPSRR